MKAVRRPQKWTKMWRSGRKSVGARYVDIAPLRSSSMRYAIDPPFFCFLAVVHGLSDSTCIEDEVMILKESSPHLVTNLLGTEG